MNRNTSSRKNQIAQRKVSLQVLRSRYPKTSEDECQKKAVSLENEKTTRKQTKKKNLNKVRNTKAVRLLSSCGPFLKWTREELQQIDQRTRKLTDDIHRLNVSRKEGGKGLASIEDQVYMTTRRLKKKKSKERIITVIRNDTNSTMRNRTRITRKQK